MSWPQSEIWATPILILGNHCRGTVLHSLPLTNAGFSNLLELTQNRDPPSAVCAEVMEGIMKRCFFPISLTSWDRLGQVLYTESISTLMVSLGKEARGNLTSGSKRDNGQSSLSFGQMEDSGKVRYSSCCCWLDAWAPVLGFELFDCCSAICSNKSGLMPRDNSACQARRACSNSSSVCWPGFCEYKLRKVDDNRDVEWKMLSWIKQIRKIGGEWTNH